LDTLPSNLPPGGQITKGHLVQTFLRFLLAYTSLPGFYGEDEEESDMTLGFWYLFQEALWTTNYFFEEGTSQTGPNFEDAQWPVAQAVYSELVQVLRRKVVWPAKNTLDRWPKGEPSLLVVAS
jgi:hypothetical protein